MKVSESLREKFEKQDLGTHMCFIYRSKEEQLSALSSFISLGIEKNEKCLYIVDDRAKEEALDAFERLGFDAEEFIDSGQFEFLTKNESYLKEGYFDPDEMIGLLDEVQNEALEEGYTGLRVTGEMTWFFSDRTKVKSLMEYESKLNEFLPDSKVIALCQYNEEKFSPEILVDVLRTHPRVLIYDELHENPYYMSPEIFTAQLKGEITREHYEGMREDLTQRTQLKRKEEESEEKLKQYKAGVEASDDSIYMIGRNYRYVFANDEHISRLFEDGKISQNSEDEVVGRKYQDIHPENDSKAFKENFEKVIETGKPRREEYRFSSLERYSSRTYSPVKDSELGEVEGVVVTSKDITERKRTEERKEFLNTLLRQDLRSKYQTIQGYHQLLEEADLPDKHKKYLRKTIETGREADEILELAEKLEEMEKAEWISEKNIVKVMNHVTDDISDLAEREKVAIEENYPESIDKVEGDYSLNTLFTQLLVTRIQLGRCSKVELDAREREEDILLSIEDDGKQLPEDIKNLFTGEVYTGETTGVGGVRYYMLREIARHNNADIEVEDSELGGSMFNIYLQKA